MSLKLDWKRLAQEKPKMYVDVLFASPIQGEKRYFVICGHLNDDVIVGVDGCRYDLATKWTEIPQPEYDEE